MPTPDRAATVIDMNLTASVISDLLDLRVPVAMGEDSPVERSSRSLINSPSVIQAMREFSRKLPREIILGNQGDLTVQRSLDDSGYEIVWLPTMTHLILEGGHCDGMIIHEDHELFPAGLDANPRRGFSLTFQDGTSRMTTAWRLSGWSEGSKCFSYHQIAPSIHDVSGIPVYSV